MNCLNCCLVIHGFCELVSQCLISTEEISINCLIILLFKTFFSQLHFNYINFLNTMTKNNLLLLSACTFIIHVFKKKLYGIQQQSNILQRGRDIIKINITIKHNYNIKHNSKNKYAIKVYN